MKDIGIHFPLLIKTSGICNLKDKWLDNYNKNWRVKDKGSKTVLEYKGLLTNAFALRPSL